MQLSTKFRQALELAFDLHHADIRKASGTPYLGHLLAVAATVIDAGGSENAAITALLHDSIEDHTSPKLREKLETQFGQEVHTLIVAASDAFSHPKPPWRERKEGHINRTQEIMTKSGNQSEFARDLALVLAADKLHNLRSMLCEYQIAGVELWKAFKGSPKDQAWYYSSMIALIEPRLPAALAAELRTTLSQFVLIAR